MTHQPKYRWVSVAEAAKHLRLSVSTIRRMVEDGRLIGEREMIGDSKERYKVRIETHLPPEMRRQDEQPSPSTEDAPRDAPAVTERSLEIFSAIFKGNLELIQAKDARILADASEIAALRERAGRWEERAIAADRRADQAKRERAEMAERLRRAETRRWWRWWR